MSASIEILQRPGFRPSRWVIAAAVAVVLAGAAVGTTVAIHRAGRAARPVVVETPAPVQIPAVTGTATTSDQASRVGARAHSGFRHVSTPAVPFSGSDGSANGRPPMCRVGVLSPC